MLTDENLNGLKVSLINETAAPRAVRLGLVCLREGETVVMRANVDLTLAPRQTIGLAASTLWGGFFDTTYAFRFGEPSHDATVARLEDAATGETIAEAFHFPLGRGQARHDLGLAAEVSSSGDGLWQLALSTRRLAQSVRIDCPGFRPQENWFHLAPGAPKRVALASITGAAQPLLGRVTALNAVTLLAISLEPR